jgi:hypothetical protein
VAQRAPSSPRNASPAALVLWLDLGADCCGTATYTNLMASVISLPFMAASGLSPSCRASASAATTTASSPQSRSLAGRSSLAHTVHIKETS